MQLVSVLDADRVVGGAALSCATHVVGVSNVFSDGPTREETWGLVTAAASYVFPGRALVGHEHGDDLELARAAGFSAVGALRIWHRPAPTAGPTSSRVSAEGDEQHAEVGT